MKYLYKWGFLLILLAGQLYAQNSGAGNTLSLDETLKTLEFPDQNGQNEFRWDPLFQEGSLLIGGHFGVFSTSHSPGKSGFLMLDNRDIYTVPLPYLENGELLFPSQFVNTAYEAFKNSIAEDSAHFRISAIIIDPGHGGEDPGGTHTMTIGGKRIVLMDKVFALKSSLFLRDLLVKRYPDKRIIMTREKDITVKLEERTRIANSIPIRKNEAVIYISIHANTSRNRSARGFEIFHLSPDVRRTVLDPDDYKDSPEIRNILNILTEEAYTAESIRIAESILFSLEAAM